MTFTGFTIDDLLPESDTNGLLNILERDMQLPGLKVMGWFLAFSLKEGAPLRLSQLIHVENSPLAGLPEGYHLTTVGPLPITILPDPMLSALNVIGGTVVPIVTGASEYITTLSAPAGALDADSIRSIEHFQPASKMFFFSTDQLTVAKSMYRQVAPKTSDAKIIFSGYSMNTGRMASPINGEELDKMHEDLTSAVGAAGLDDVEIDSQRYAKWFSLKMEVVARSAPGVASSASVPMAFFSHPCPPSWHT